MNAIKKAPRPMSPEHKKAISDAHKRRREEKMRQASNDVLKGGLPVVVGWGQSASPDPIEEDMELDREAIEHSIPMPYVKEMSSADIEAMLNDTAPPVTQDPKLKVFPIHRCMNCGWIGRDITFLDAIALHAKERHPCKPSLTQPSEKYLTQKLLEQAKSNPHRFHKILERYNQNGAT